MRTALCVAIGLAALVSVVPASFAQHPRVPDHGKPAGTGIEAKERQTSQRPARKAGISLAVPMGRVWVSPESVKGEAVYVRRSKVSEGMTIVEVSTTPFIPILPSNEPAGAKLTVRSDQPASW
jgi:hypothetical protein